MSFEKSENAGRLYSSDDIEDDESQGLLRLRSLVKSRKSFVFSLPHVIGLYVSNAVLLVLVIVLLIMHNSHDPTLGIWCMRNRSSRPILDKSLMSHCSTRKRSD